MFGSEILDIGIGVAFVYLLLSLVCSVLNEWIAGVMGLRAKNLEAGIRSLFSDGKLTIPASGDSPKIEKFLADAIYDHGLIQSQFRADWSLLRRKRRLALPLGYQEWSRWSGLPARLPAHPPPAE